MTNLERIRHEKEMTQFQLCIGSGIEQCRISLYENEANNIDNARIETVCKLAKALGVRAWEILSDDLGEQLRSMTETGLRFYIDDKFETSRFKAMRQKENYTQKELADMLSMSQQAIGKWERCGVENARIKSICFICAALCCHPCDLIDNTEIRKMFLEVLKNDG